MDSEKESEHFSLIATKIEKGLKRGMHKLPLKLFSEDLLKKLGILSITTAEEFVGMIMADSQATANFLGLTVEEVEDLKVQTLQILPNDARNKLIKPVDKPEFTLGALNPN